MLPDYTLIAETRLFAMGYRSANLLSRKMIATFRLASEQLSTQAVTREEPHIIVGTAPSRGALHAPRLR